MPYKVYKLIDDKRNHTCGYQIPNGGFYHVVEMTFENHRQLENLSSRAGYSVDYVEGKCGFFDVDGYEVDQSTLQIDKITKQVLDYERKTRTYRGKQKEIQEEHKEGERDMALEHARRLGLRVSELSSTRLILDEIGRRGERAQASLTS